MRPVWIAPLLILAWSAIAFGVLFSTERYDDFAGWAGVVAVSHLLVWIGMRGDPSDTPGRGERVAIAIGGALPTAAWPTALTPWVVQPGGLESLGTVIMMMLFGIPLALVAAAVLLFRLARASRRVALQRTIIVVGATAVVAWALAIGWSQAGGRGSQQALELLVFPGLATWWLGLPAMWLARR